MDATPPLPNGTMALPPLALRLAIEDPAPPGSAQAWAGLAPRKFIEFLCAGCGARQRCRIPASGRLPGKPPLWRLQAALAFDPLTGKVRRATFTTCSRACSNAPTEIPAEIQQAIQAYLSPYPAAAIREARFVCVHCRRVQIEPTVPGQPLGTPPPGWEHVPLTRPNFTTGVVCQVRLPVCGTPCLQALDAAADKGEAPPEAIQLELTALRATLPA